MGKLNWAHTRLMAFGALPIEVPMSVPASEWAETVRTVLAEIPTVENIDVSVDPDELPDGALAADDGFVPVQDNLRDEFWPEPIGALIQFDLKIPAHLQVVTPSGKEKVGHEHFRVRTFYGYDGPCTIITLLGHDDANQIQSAWAVSAVYHYLKQAFNEKGNRLRIGRIGPSPFHMETLLRPGDDDQEKFFVIKDEATLGYRMVSIRYQPPAVGEEPDLDAIEDAVALMVKDQLSLFYSLERGSNRLQSLAVSLSSDAGSLMAAHSQGKIVGWAKRVFGTAAIARKLGLDALALSIMASDWVRTSQASVTGALAQTNTIPLFEDALKRIVDEDLSPTIDNAREVVSFVESGRRSEFEVLMVSSATLLGGVAGGVVGWVATTAAGGS